ncbi:MAG: 3-hydroxymyristoyl/3-hydroxydecanoyl-(acyl carrier protein) dehydratase [Candidatus Azotimanducaceae bacterium]
MIVEIPIPEVHACYPHHFPDHTLVPGYLLLELIGEVLTAADIHTCGVRQAKFLLPVYPGELACLNIDTKPNRANVALTIDRQLRLSAKFEVNELGP